MDHHKRHCRSDKILFVIITWALFAFFLSGGNTLFAGEPGGQVPFRPGQDLYPRRRRGKSRPGDPDRHALSRKKAWSIGLRLSTSPALTG